MMFWPALATTLLVSVHLLAGRFHDVVGPGRSPVHSFFAGITTAYLFLKLLPELGAPGAIVGDDPSESQRRLAYAIALLGFVVFYAAEVWAHQGASGSATRNRERRRTYGLMLVTFALFNAGLAFLLPQQVATYGPWLTGTYVVAIGVHLLALDHAIAEVHGGRYGIRERVIHSGGLIAGFVVAITLGPGAWDMAAQPLVAFLAGAIALQIFREEIPAYKIGRPVPFALGAATLGLLLLLAERIGAVT